MAMHVELKQRGFPQDEIPFDDRARDNLDQSDSEHGGVIVRKGNKAFGLVPFDLIECKFLSVLARLVAVWIESKPEGWKVYPSVLQKALGITEKQWLSARRSMIAAGIFKHTRHRSKQGKWFWDSEFDLTPILNSIPPLAAHGKAADIKVRDTKIRNNSRQRTEAHCTDVQCAPPVSLKSKPMPIKQDIDDLKRLHIGHVLNDLDIDWWERGAYIYCGDFQRARKAEDGRWLWVEVDRKGEVSMSGSAIDLIAYETGCSTAQAINQLRRIYNGVVKR